jgi:hypothetical protein
MELSDQDKALINDLINIAWQAGAVKAPQMAQTIEVLRQKLQKPKEPPKEAKK